ncbi:MAG TPA: hypothetical protein PKE64_16570 [Anaerolineae bacterium]|nr:hypothetical protein [Anaerolineae bacterium]HMR65624.1 hypothetical protein [Anaerolineae bacterium]
MLAKRKWQNAFRYALWLSLAETAEANRRHFGLTTTWLPHLLGNSFILLVPELYRLLDRGLGLSETITHERSPSLAALRASFEQLTRDNPGYVTYVAPVTLAYLVSHPRFNIYRGRWGELTLLGFGLDSIPHSTTAYGLTNLVIDTVETVDRQMPADAALAGPAHWLANHKILVSGAVLGVLTVLYESAEYVIYRSELKARDNDPTQINMMWGTKDTVFDVLSNILGWLIAVWRRHG